MKNSGVPFVTPQARKEPKGNKWRIGTAVLRIRMAGGVGGGSENLPPTRLANSHSIGCLRAKEKVEVGIHHCYAPAFSVKLNGLM